MTKKYQAYESIKTRLISHQLTPEHPLTELSLSRILGMGRTPIREALNLLTKDGIIQSIPNKGFIPRKLSAEDLLRLYQIREVLDGLAAGLAAERIELSEIDKIENKYFDGRLPDWESGRCLSAELHSLVYRSCGNPYLLEIYKGLELKVDLAMHSLWKFWLASNATESLQRRNQEHAKIIRCMRERDPVGAERESKEHISNTIKDIVSIIAGRRIA